MQLELCFLAGQTWILASSSQLWHGPGVVSADIWLVKQQMEDSSISESHSASQINIFKLLPTLQLICYLHQVFALLIKEHSEYLESNLTNTYLYLA